MRSLAFASVSLFAVAVVLQAPLPALLARHFQTLAEAPSLTVTYTVQPVGGAKAPYKLVLSKPGVFILTTPTGLIQSDGKSVTTYNSETNKYTVEPVTDAWIASFVRKPEVLPWGGFLLKKPADEIETVAVKSKRMIGTASTTECDVKLKKGPSATLYLDAAFGFARGAAVKGTEQDTLVLASKIESTKDPLAADLFAFVPPAGAEKEEIAAKVNFASVQALLNDKCLPCHNAVNAKDGVVVTNYEGIMAIVTPGNPAQSGLIRSVKASGGRRMPKGRDPLTAAEIKLLEAWITAGAKQ